MGLPKHLITGRTAKFPTEFQGFTGLPATRLGPPTLPEERIVRQLVIPMPLPDSGLLPNRKNRRHWGHEAKLIKDRRKLAAHLGFLARRRTKMIGTWKRCTVGILAWYKTRRHPDPDNLIAAMKSTFDGLADGLVFANDRELTILPPKFFVGPRRMILVLARTE